MIKQTTPSYCRFVCTLAVSMLLSWGGDASATEPDPPAWWSDPIKEDPGNYFFTATAASAANFDEALQEAQKNALEHIIARLGGSSSPAIHDYLLANIRGWKIHAKDEKQVGRNYHTWIIVRYPKDELNDIRSYLENGARMFQESVEKHGQTKFDDALVILDRIIAEYPLGKQPVFMTERALLLSSDCWLGKGAPRRAREACKSVLNASRENSFLKEANARLEAIQVDYANILLRGVFSGKRIVTRCVVELNGSLSEWIKLQKEMESLFAKAESRSVGLGSDNIGVSAVRDLVVSPDKAVTWMTSASADGLALFWAEGIIKTRKNEKNVLTGQDYQFSGSVRSLVVMRGEEPVSLDRTGLTGWNPVSPKMCLDVLALNMIRDWKEDVVKRYDQK